MERFHPTMRTSTKTPCNGSFEANSSRLMEFEEYMMRKIALFCSGGQGPDSPYTPEMTYVPKRAADWDACADDTAGQRMCVL